MIQVTLDPSLLTAVNSTEEKTCEISLRINSVSYKQEEEPPETIVGNIESISKLLFPWHWDKPSHIRIRWISNTALHGAPVDIDLTKFLNNNAADTKTLQKFNEETIFFGILNDFKGPDEDPTAIHEVLMNTIMASHDFTNGINHDSTIADNYEKSKDDFLLTFISKVSQELPPLNHYSNLVFLGTKLDVQLPNTSDPDKKVDGFIAFPIYKAEDGEEEKPNIWKPTNDEKIIAGTDSCEIPYKDFDKKTIKAYCPITPLPKPPENEEDLKTPGIHLRDKNGDFLGHVNLQVNDVADQTLLLIETASVFFNLPRYLLNYISLKLGDTTTVDQKKILNNVFLSLIRDTLNFGIRSESDGNSLLNRLARAFADLGGELKSLDNAGQITYWQRYENIANKLRSQATLEDQKYKTNDGLVKWKDIIKTMIDNEKQIKNKLTEKVEGVSLVSASAMKLIEKLDSSVELDFEQWKTFWNKVLEELNTNTLLQYRIIFAQWNAVITALESVDPTITALIINNQPEPLIQKVKWFEQVFRSAGDLISLGKETIAMEFKEGLIESLEKDLHVPLLKEDPTEEPGDFVKVTLEAIKHYFELRIKNRIEKIINGQPIVENNTFFPPIANPFDDPLFTDTLTLAEFIDSIVKESNQKEVDKEITEKLKITFPIPPNIRLKIDALKVKAADEDDLNDEIAGHIVLMRRADEIGIKEGSPFTKSWRYLNWAKVQAVSYIPGTEIVGSTKKEPDQVLKQTLDKPYIAPVFLPESDGNKNSFLQISNEKISLVAGHETNDDADTKGDKYAHIEYLFDEIQNDAPTRFISKAYAFWYGYQYQFAGFVALNSGVLPEVIRENKDVWNIPVTDETRLENLQINADFIEGYEHLRRVPVSKVRIEAKGTTDKTAPLPVPKGLFPLAFEMPEWGKKKQENDNLPESAEASNNTEENTQDQGNDIVHYLLGDGTYFRQNKIQLTIRKPTTPYWNWYAWQGENTKKINNDDLDKLSIGESALAQELEIREKATDPTRKTSDQEGHLLDPAVNSLFLITIQKIFPVLSEKPKLKEIKREDLFKWGDDNSGLEDVRQNLTIEIGNSTTLDVKNAKLFVKAGEVVKVNIYCLIEESFFNGNNRKFHEWMHNVTSPEDEPSSIDGKKYYLTHPQQIWFEAAANKDILLPDGPPILNDNEKKEALKKTIKDLNGKLWKTLLITQNEGNEEDKRIFKKDKVFLKINKGQPDFISKKFAYTSRAEIRHQVWYWNGRLDESRQLLKEDGSGIIDLNPEDQKTNDAMRWEAWAFSDRPDFSALVQETNLLAYRPKSNTAVSSDLKPQLMFTDYRPSEKKALYYRFSATLYSRYELLGNEYKFSLESQKPLEKGMYDRWKRHIKKYDNTESSRLPKPSIRFAIPLTKSIKECSDMDTISGASVLIILDDRWFTEGGLAEQFELGVEVAKWPQKPKENEPVEGYMSLGNDPTLTGKSLTSLNNNLAVNKGGAKYPYRESSGEKDMMVFEAKGPTGLTFDFAAQTPRLKGCAFVVEIPDLSVLLNEINDKANQTNILNAWSMIEISVRRALRPQFCENQAGAEQQISEWTAKQWVQFLPSVDSFIPKAWKKAVALNNALSVKILVQADAPASFTIEEGNKLPDFDPIFEDLHERFLIVTKRVYDIGGQPCENYVGTYHYKDINNKETFILNHPKEPQLSDIKEGFFRILVVRKPRNYAGEYDAKDIWTHLFGDNVSEKPDLNKVQNDPTAALPLVSERIPFKI